jgi:hypothetical protein
MAANRIMGVIKKRHLLLATLFIANAAAMSALPIFLYLYATHGPNEHTRGLALTHHSPSYTPPHSLLGPLPAVLLAVGTILIAGECVHTTPHDTTRPTRH